MDLFIENPLKKYEELLLFHLYQIYDARKATSKDDMNRYSDLLIEKFAIHSSTLFHLINGIIESTDSTKDLRKAGFDLFTVNSLIRVIIETYITFNHLFVNPRDEKEKEFKLLLWRLDGLYEKSKFRIQESDYEKAKEVLETDVKTMNWLCNSIEKHSFINYLNPDELKRIYNPTEKKASWRFLYKNGNARLLKIIDLIEYTCPMRAFFNLYRHASMHTHSGFVSIEQFEEVRGKVISNRYVNNFPRMASLLTIFLIKDISEIDKNAALVFSRFSKQDQEEFNGMNKACRQDLSSLPTDPYSKWRQ